MHSGILESYVKFKLDGSRVVVKHSSKRSAPNQQKVGMTDSRSGASRVLVPALSLTVMVVALLQTVVVPVLAQIGDALDASASAVGWTVTVTLLAAAVFTPLLSRIGDLYGRRRVLIGILLVVAAGSLLAAVTTSLLWLLVGRILQGASFGLFPLSIGILRHALPAYKLTSAMAIVSGTLGIGGGIGLVLTGLLTRDGGDYHRIFWLSLMASLIALLLVVMTVPKHRPDRAGRIDWLGGFLLGASLVLLLLPLSQGHQWGWSGPSTLGCFAGSALVLALWLMVERRLRDPLVPLVLMSNRPFMTTNLAGLFIGFGMFVTFLGISGFVQTPAGVGYGFSASVIEASCIYLLPAALVGVITAPIGGRLVRLYGGRTTLIIAALIGLSGFLLMAMLHSQSWHIIVGGSLANGAVSMGYAALPALIVAEVSPGETGIANGVNSIARSIGSALGSALVITLLSSNLLATGVPHESAYTAVFLIGAASMICSAFIVAVGLPKAKAVRLASTELAFVHARITP